MIWGWFWLWVIVGAIVMGGGTILALASDDSEGVAWRAWCARVALAAPLWPLMAIAGFIAILIRLTKLARRG